MADYALVGEAREGVGKGVARKLRAAGRIPGVVYGKKLANQPITLDPHALEKILSKGGMNSLIDLEVPGGKRTVLVKDLQRDPVRGVYLHADFYEVDLAQSIEVSVPLHFSGKARGTEFGGIVDHPLRELDIECLPGAIPEFIEVDVSPLDLNESLHVRDLAVPEGVTVRTDGDLPVAAVIAPAAAEEAEAAEGGEVAEGAKPAEKAEGAE